MTDRPSCFLADLDHLEKQSAKSTIWIVIDYLYQSSKEFHFPRQSGSEIRPIETEFCGFIHPQFLCNCGFHSCKSLSDKRFTRAAPSGPRERRYTKGSGMLPLVPFMNFRPFKGMTIGSSPKGLLKGGFNDFAAYPTGCGMIRR
jgi:hypothetical protein